MRSTLASIVHSHFHQILLTLVFFVFFYCLFLTVKRKCKISESNAIYVLAHRDSRLLDGYKKISEWEHNALKKLALPGHKLRIPSRFMSFHKIHRRRRPVRKLSNINREALDELYYLPAKMLLKRVHCWNFNIFHFDILTGGRPLLYLVHHIFRKYGFINCFQLDTIKLLRFTSLIEDNYHDSNPYHHAIHAADVTQAINCLMQEDKLRNSLSKFEAMMAIVSAMSHDVDHPGVNQTFLVATDNLLAALYHNTSVLEMHHWRYGLGLIQESGLFSHFTGRQWTTALWQFRSLILATDITRQQEFLIKFRRMIDEEEYENTRNSQTHNFILQIALKCADINSPCRPWPISERWSYKVCEEFFRQGDIERKKGVHVTPICDRHTNTVAKIQIGFIEMVVRPLFMEWKRFLPTVLSQKILENIQNNKEQWQSICEKDRARRMLCLSKSLHRASSDTNQSNAKTSEAGPEDKSAEVFNGEGEELMEEGGFCREEENIVEKEANLTTHYQTDWEQMSEGSPFLPPVSEDEQPTRLSCSARRRYSMSVVGLRRDSFTFSNLQRRQSLPDSSRSARVGLGVWASKGRHDFQQKI